MYYFLFVFFFNDTATTEIYTLSLHDALPISEIWREAGILSGTLARLQGYKSDQRRRVLNDALLFATARKHGCSVLTRNVLDFDFLQQLNPSGKVLFYR